MAEIIPAILPKDFDELEEKLELIRGFADEVQIDICDGAFVPSKTWPYAHIPDDRFEAIVSQEEGLPFWEEFDFEFDMMVKNPLQKIADFISLGGKRLIVHLDSANDEEIEDILKEYANEDVRDFDVEIGFGISAQTDMNRALEFAGRATFVQCMGIRKIGFQGQEFDESVIDRINLLRHKFPKLIISVDGGVNEENIPDLVAAGADRLVIGSAIWESDAPSDMIEHFQNLAK